MIRLGHVDHAQKPFEAADQHHFVTGIGRITCNTMAYSFELVQNRTVDEYQFLDRVSVLMNLVDILVRFFAVHATMELIGRQR